MAAGTGWGRAFALGVALYVLAIAALEVAGRRAGYRPIAAPDNDRALWAVQRERVDHDGPNLVALAGNSRMMRSFSSPALRDALPDGDYVQLAVLGQDALSGEFEIRPAGVLVVPVAGAVPAAGRTLAELSADITRRLEGVVAGPRVTVVLALRAPTSVGVMGEVRTPGRYDVAEGEGVLHALARAGGLTPFADPEGIYVVRPQPSQRIRFRYSDLTSAEGASMRFRLSPGDVVVVE